MSKSDKRIAATKTHEEMVSEWMGDPVFKAGYDALEEEYQLLWEMLQARKKSGLTQEDVAKRMGTKAPVVARLEAYRKLDKHSPSISTLRKYARAVGCKLEIHLKPAIKQVQRKKA